MKLGAVTAKYVGKTFAEVGCLELCYRVLREMGKPVPAGVGPWGVENYAGLVARSIRSAQRVMLASFWQVGRGVPVRAAAPGDLLAVLQKGPVVFPAVHVGRGLAIASFIRRGVEVFRLDEENRAVMARRIE